MAVHENPRNGHFSIGLGKPPLWMGWLPWKGPLMPCLDKAVYIKKPRSGGRLLCHRYAVL